MGDSRTAVERPSVSDYLLVLALSLVYTFLFADRMAISILIDQLKQEFGLSDGQIGFLQSAPILICYLLIGPLIARFSDRISRRWTIVVGLCTWVVLSSMSAVATSFVTLLIFRLGAGIGEVALVPSANATLAGRFGGPGRNIAIGCFMSAPYVGIALGMSVGGWLLAQPDHGLLSPLPQWRLLFPMLCIPGLAITLLLMFFREKRDTGAVESSVRPISLLDVLKARPGFYASLFIGTTMCSTIGYAATTWMPAYLMRTFQMSPAEAAELLSVSVIVGGVAGAAGGSLLAALGQRFRHDAPLWLGLASFVGMLVLAKLLFNGQRPSMFALYALMALPTLPYAGLIAFMQGQTPEGARARVGAAYAFLEAILGLAGGSLAVGLVTDLVYGSEALVGHSIFIIVVAASVVALASMLFLLLSRKHAQLEIPGPKSELVNDPAI